MTPGEARERAAEMLEQAGFALTPAEREGIEVTDFGLGRLEEAGLQLVVYVNTERVCAKELVLFPHQICPEHRHPPVGADPGKEETFRCRQGAVVLHIAGLDEIVLTPGDQFTIPPDTRLNAQRKAYTAARSDARTTRELAVKAAADPVERASFDPFFTFFLGGVAVFDGDRRIGAVGVSGLPGEVDERLALLAIERSADR